MVQGTKKVYLFGFAIGLLLFVNVIRSGVLVDRSFLPRFFLLSVLLLITWLIRFKKKNIVQSNFFTSAFILYFLWNLASCFWAISPSEAIMQAQLVFLSLALFLIISSFTCLSSFPMSFPFLHVIPSKEGIQKHQQHGKQFNTFLDSQSSWE